MSGSKQKQHRPLPTAADRSSHPSCRHGRQLLLLPPPWTPQHQWRQGSCLPHMWRSRGRHSSHVCVCGSSKSSQGMAAALSTQFAPLAHATISTHTAKAVLPGAQHTTQQCHTLAYRLGTSVHLNQLTALQTPADVHAERCGLRAQLLDTQLSRLHGGITKGTARTHARNCRILSVWSCRKLPVESCTRRA